jgi:RHS repeat-associated protein
METTSVLNERGTVAEALDYYPYGGQRIDSKTNYGGVRNKYAGTVYDALSGLNYMLARYQNSSRGQFISQYPVFWEVGLTDTGRAILSAPQLMNSYSYAADNPITGKDADGRLVELVSRPIGGFFAPVGAHTFVAIIPENSKTIGASIPYNLSRPFTLGGYTDQPQQYNLYKSINKEMPRALLNFMKRRCRE